MNGGDCLTRLTQVLQSRLSPICKVATDKARCLSEPQFPHLPKRLVPPPPAASAGCLFFFPSPASWGQGRRGLAGWRGGGALLGPSQAGQAPVCKLPELRHGPPPPRYPPPPPRPSAALAAAEPGGMANILAPSEQDQCLGRECGQSLTCTRCPHPTTTPVPLGSGEGREVRPGRWEVDRPSGTLTAP